MHQLSTTNLCFCTGAQALTWYRRQPGKVWWPRLCQTPYGCPAAWQRWVWNLQLSLPTGRRSPSSAPHTSWGALSRTMATASAGAKHITSQKLVLIMVYTRIKRLVRFMQKTWIRMSFSHYLFQTSLSLLLLLLLFVAVVTVFGVWGFDLSTDRCVRTRTNSQDFFFYPPPECHSTDITEHFQQWKCGHAVTRLFLERGRWGLARAWFYCAGSAVCEVQFSLEKRQNCFPLDHWFHNIYTI